MREGRWQVISKAAVVAATSMLVGGCVVFVPSVPIAPEGVSVTTDVAAGYDRYAGRLAAYGRWSPDHQYGAHWCPSRATLGDSASLYEPYVDRGHWAISDRQIGAAPQGSPFWVSDDGDTWGEITTHHGYWISVDSAESGRSWCWVPGVEETAARVVWRTGDGFVGWAPEPPDVVVYDEVDYDALDWVFTFVGVLLDGSPRDEILYDDARVVAADATSSGVEQVRGGSGYKPAHVGPSGLHISKAQKLFVDYAIAHHASLHQVAVNQATAAANASSDKPSASASDSKTSDASDSKKDDAKKDDAKKDDTKKVRVVAMTYYEAMLDDPMLGPIELVPRVHRLPQGGADEVYDPGAPPSPGSGSSGSGSPSGSSSGGGSGAASGHASSAGSHSSSGGARVSAGGSHTSSGSTYAKSNGASSATTSTKSTSKPSSSSSSTTTSTPKIQKK